MSTERGAIQFALRIDLVNEPELHRLISDGSPIRSHLLSASEAMLRAIGVDDAQVHAWDFVALVDSLLSDQLTNPKGAAKPTRLVLAYLKGLQLGPAPT